MIYLCKDIFLIIYNFVGHNALYLNKEYYKYLRKLRKEFINNPIKLKYIIITYKVPGNGITRLNFTKTRVSFKISNDIDELIIKKNISIGNIIKIPDDEILKDKDIDYEIEPSYQIKKLIFKNPNIIFNHDNIYIKTNVIYYDIFRLWSDNIDRVNKYNKLWIK